MATWKQFRDYPYEVSDLGDVRRIGKSKPLKPISNGKYLYVALTAGPGKGGFWKAHYIHRLVAELYVTPRENANDVNHIDGNKHHNAATNLEWVTPSENGEKAVIAGLIAVGEERSTAKYTNDQIAKVRELHARRNDYSNYLVEIGMPAAYARAVVAGRKRRHG